MTKLKRFFIIYCLCLPPFLLTACANFSSSAEDETADSLVLVPDFEHAETENLHKGLMRFLDKDKGKHGKIKLSSTSWQEGFLVIQLRGEPHFEGRKDSKAFYQEIMKVAEKYNEAIKVLMNGREVASQEPKPATTDSLAHPNE